MNFVDTKRHELGLEHKGYISWETGSPLLRRYLNSISLAVHGKYADWSWNGTSGWIGPPADARVQAILAKKATKNYPPGYDELWLIIYGGAAISRTFVVSDVAELQVMTSANAELAKAPFDVVALWDPFRPHVYYEWTRTESWRARSQTR